MTPPVSVYIRTLNEAAMLGETLEAARQISDDIVIVDSGSTDDTIEIAEAAGARVIRQPWLGWGKQKRIGEDACRCDWLFDLDADEIITPALAAEINALFANGAPAEQAFHTPMRVVRHLGGREITLGRVSRMKLYDRRAVRAPDHVLWDQFDPPRGLKTGVLRATIEHRAFRDAAHLTAKLNSYSSGVAAAKPLKSRGALALRVVFGLPVYFLKRYIFEGLVFSGVYGFAFSMMTAHGRWLRDVKMYERARTAKE
jgi:glycosyltransferase involved in cell wall biosynthesis